MRRIVAIPGAIVSLSLSLTACGGSATSVDATPAASPTVTQNIGNCTDQQAQEGLATVTGQIASLSAGDYTGALTFSSRDYRAGVTPESFGAIIESDYALLTTDPRVRMQGCQPTPEGALILDVDVIGTTSSAQMRYALVREQGKWLIRVAGLTGGSLELPA